MYMYMYVYIYIYIYIYTYIYTYTLYTLRSTVSFRKFNLEEFGQPLGDLNFQRAF